MRNHQSLLFSRLALVPLLLGMATVFSCAGNERAPHQPVKGVDTEKNEVKNPYDKMSGLTAPRVKDQVAAEAMSPKGASKGVFKEASKKRTRNEDLQSKGGEKSGQNALAFLETFRQASR